MAAKNKCVKTHHGKAGGSSICSKAMGHDFITYHDRHVHLHDAVIELLQHFFLEEAGSAQPSDLNTDEETLTSLRSFFEAWESAGPGVWMGTDFTIFVQGQPERRDVLRIFLERVSERVKRFGDLIPMTYLNGHHLDWGRDYPTEKVVVPLGKLIEMLRD